MLRLRGTPAARVLVALPFLQALTGCGGGTGGSGGPTGSFIVEEVNVTPAQPIPLNHTIVLRFSHEVEPATVQAGLVIYQTTSQGAVQARGLKQVIGREVRFLPSLPSRPDLADAGLLPDTSYTICVARENVPCGTRLPPPWSSVRSRGGKRLARGHTTVFRTLPSGEPRPFSDPLPGPPLVTRIEPVDGSAGVPQGEVLHPTRVTVHWNEPLWPASVSTQTIGLYRRGEPEAIRLRLVELLQGEPARAQVRLTPQLALPCGAALEVRWTAGVTDLIGNGAFLPNPSPGFTVTSDCPPATSLIETFEDTLFLDRTPALPPGLALAPAEWAVAGAAVLRANHGFGGDGRHGRLELAAGAALDLATIDPSGVFHFRSIALLAGSTLRFSGTSPLRLLCAGDALIDGILELTGGPGTGGIAGSTAQPSPGGAGVAGGGAGGPGNAVPGQWTSPGGAGRGSGPISNIGGGRAGNDSTIVGREGCGGGGGAYATSGSSGSFACANAANQGSLGGSPYGDLSLLSLLGGSGGGGGGNAAVTGSPFPGFGHHSGGGGGAGGGAVSIEALGTLTIAPNGRLLLNGGAGGTGGGPAGSKGGDGGGGSGGAFKAQAGTIVLQGGAQIRALGGTSPSGLGAGAVGRVRLEDLDGAIGGTNQSSPAPSTAIFLAPGNGRSVAQSLFYDTGLSSPVFEFDGSDPGTGLAFGSTSDLDFETPPSTAQVVRITFQGAPPNPAQPGEPHPDPTQWVPPQPPSGPGVAFTPNLADLGGRGLRFIRFRVEFDTGPVRAGQPLPVQPAVQTLRVRFH